MRRLLVGAVVGVCVGFSSQSLYADELGDIIDAFVSAPEARCVARVSDICFCEGRKCKTERAKKRATCMDRNEDGVVETMVCQMDGVDCDCQVEGESMETSNLSRPSTTRSSNF